jgi:hypothetical protein
VGRARERETETLIQAAHRPFHRSLTVVGRLDGERADGVSLLDGRDLVLGRAAAYVCRRYACQLPVTEADAVAAGIASGG